MLIRSRLLRRPVYKSAPQVSGAVPGMGAAEQGAVQTAWAEGGPTRSAWVTLQLSS